MIVLFHNFIYYTVSKNHYPEQTTMPDDTLEIQDGVTINNKPN